MTILVTGSSGKTSSRVAPQLAAAAASNSAYQPLVASRAGTNDKGFPAVKFDWLDPSTHEAPFEHALAKESPIIAVYLVAPVHNMSKKEDMTDFMEVAAKHGVKRFVFLGGNVPVLIEVEEFLKEKGEKEGWEWASLQPTWFMENFSESYFLPDIIQNDKIYTTTGDGKAPFISAHDIAAVAVQSLISEKPPNQTYEILGPELLTNSDVAAALSKGLGRHIEHIKLSESERAEHLVNCGLPEPIAQALARMERDVAAHKLEELNDTVERVTGRKGKTIDEYVEENKAVWAKKA